MSLSLGSASYAPPHRVGSSATCSFTVPHCRPCGILRPCGPARSHRAVHSRAPAPFGARHHQTRADRGAWRGTAFQCTSPAAQVLSNAGKDVDDVKQELLAAIEGTNRGIGGVPAEKRRGILDLIARLEELQPAESPTEDLQRVAGAWKLLFSTISITGLRRTKLGLRQFITLGEFTQSIDLDRSLATNQVDFSVTGVGMFKGYLRIEASYKVAGPQRVTIDFENATLAPQQLQALFEQNFDLLLSIFNPEGWLDITFLDSVHRVGRDDKGNVFLLERL